MTDWLGGRKRNVYALFLQRLPSNQIKYSPFSVGAIYYTYCYVSLCKYELVVTPVKVGTPQE